MGKIIDMIKLINALPELSRPGIDEESIYTFLKKSKPKTPPAILKFIASEFMNILPDSNMFSQLELMILSNTVKNNFISNNDLDFCTGIANIIEKYDRTNLNYQDLLSTVKTFSTANRQLISASKEIKKSLDKLNKKSSNIPLIENKNHYDALLQNSYELRKEDNDDQMNLEEAVLLNPRRSEAYFSLSEWYNNNDRFEDAVDVIDYLIKTEPCNIILSKAYLARAELFFDNGNYIAALQNLDGVDDNDYKKYRIRDVCLAYSGIIRSSKQELKSILKEFWHCYAKPGFAYLRSKKKQRRLSEKVLKKIGFISNF